MEPDQQIESRQDNKISPNSLSLKEGEDNFDIGIILKKLRRRKKLFIVAASSSFIFAIFYTGFLRIYRPIYRGSFSILIQSPIDKADSGLGGTAAGATLSAIAGKRKNDIPTLITLLKSPILLEKVANEVGMSPTSLDRIISIDQRSKTLSSRSAKGILNVNILINDKKNGLRLVNKVLDSYLQISLDEKQKNLKEGLDFLSIQLPKARLKNTSLRSDLASFREKNKVFNPKMEVKLLKESIVSIEEDISGTKSIIQKAIDTRMKVKNGTLLLLGFNDNLSNQTRYSINVRNTNTGIPITSLESSYLKEVQLLKQSLSQAKMKYKDNSKVVRSLEKKIKKIKPIFLKDQLETLDAADTFYQERLKLLEKEYFELQMKFQQNLDLVKDYNILVERIKINSLNLANLTKIKDDFELELSQSSIPWRILDLPSVTQKPIYPSISKNTFLAIIGSGIIGLIAVLIRDKFDNIFHSESEIKELISDPILVNIPFVDSFKDIRDEESSIINLLDLNTDVTGSDTKNEDSTSKYNLFFFKEAFRNLYTSIRFLSTDNKIKSICLTSSIPGEGKSIINILLAKTLAEMGERVLLIDADLRKPQLHHRLGLDNFLGLSNLITDSSLNLDSVINKLAFQKNLNVITSGLKPPDPTRLLNSKRFKEISKQINKNEEFDFIIYDAPPFLGLADASFISNESDGIILIITLELVDKKLPKKTIDRINSSNSKLLGIVVNSTKENKDSDKSDNSYYSAYATYANTEKKKVEIPEESQKKISLYKKIKAITIKLLNWIEN